jgi:hypothetical protein
MPVLRYWDVASSSYIAVSGYGVQGPQGAQGASPPVSSPLAYVRYAPATAASYALTTSLAAVDTTNLTIRFTAPQSGSVILRASIFTLVTNSSTVNTQCFMGLAFVNHGTNTQVSPSQRFVDWVLQAAQTGVFQGGIINYETEVTGLSPGTNYQWDLAGYYWVGGGTGAGANLYADAGTAGTTTGPAVISVYDSAGVGAQGPQGVQGPPGGSPVSTSPLASQVYSPASLAAYTVTVGTSPVVLDGTNLTISFKAPQSGTVIIEANFMARINIPTTQSEAWMMFCFVTHGTTTIMSAQQRFLDFLASSQTLQNSATVHYQQRVTGLVSGTTYQWDLAGWTSGANATGNVYVDSGGSPNYAGPASIFVWDGTGSGSIGPQGPQGFQGAGVIPGGPAGQDLSGTYPNPTVARIRANYCDFTNPSTGVGGLLFFDAPSTASGGANTIQVGNGVSTGSMPYWGSGGVAGGNGTWNGTPAPTASSQMMYWNGSSWALTGSIGGNGSFWYWNNSAYTPTPALAGGNIGLILYWSGSSWTWFANGMSSASGQIAMWNGSAWTTTLRERVSYSGQNQSNNYTPNVDQCEVFTIGSRGNNSVSPTANFTINAPAGTANDGQRLLFRIWTPGNYAISWASPGYYPSGNCTIPPTSNNGTGNDLFVLFIFAASAGQWICVAANTGY